MATTRSRRRWKPDARGYYTRQLGWTRSKTNKLSHPNRPFGKVFQAIRDVQEYIEPVFKAAGANPFAPQAQAYTKRSVIESIIAMHEQGYPNGQIANTVGVSPTAVGRHIKRHNA